jgi:hypothetical protein
MLRLAGTAGRGGSEGLSSITTSLSHEIPFTFLAKKSGGDKLMTYLKLMKTEDEGVMEIAKTLVLPQQTVLVETTSTLEI